MSGTTVEKIKDRLDIVEVVGSYLQLQKAGVNFKAKCPFHNERTPSFVVSPNRGTFYCFGCHEKGDIFSFVEKFEGTDFKGALKVLADRAGVPLEKENLKEKSEHERLYKILDTARIWFEENLEKQKDVTEYLKKRGVKIETIESENGWSIGFAPAEWRELRNFLTEKGFTTDEQLKAGLIKEKDGKYYDTFRGRIMFPLFETNGKVVGFSGRTLSKDPNTPKYVNSPETVLFNKSELLYGLHKAKGEIRKKNYSILVEGQMDLIMSHQAGLSNTVASSGTALTPGHVRKLKKISPRIVLAYDGDEAGLRAAEKAGRLALGEGMEVKILQLPEGSDPADVLLKDKKIYTDALKKSKHIIDFELDLSIAETKDKRALGKIVSEKVLPYVRDLERTIDKAYYVSQIARRLGVREEAIWDDIKKLPDRVLFEKSAISGISVNEKKENPFSISSLTIEKRVMGILYWKPELKEFKEKIIEIIGEERYLSMLDETDANALELAYIAEEYFEDTDVFEHEQKELLLSLEKKHLQDEIFTLQESLHKSGEGGRSGISDTESILRQIHEKTTRIEEIKQSLGQAVHRSLH